MFISIWILRSRNLILNLRFCKQNISVGNIYTVLGQSNTFINIRVIIAEDNRKLEALPVDISKKMWIHWEVQHFPKT